MLLKKMITTVKSAMKLMITIQLKTKMKILTTKHVVKPYFYNVIFWNMKYLFFFNCQLLLLCCVCCKFAIQDFVKGIHKKIRNIDGFTDGYTDGL